MSAARPSSTPATPAPILRKPSRLRRWLIGLGVAFVVCVVFGFFGLPPILKSQLVKRAGLALHREVTVGVIKVNPLVLSLTIEDLAIKDRDGAPFAGWRRLYVNFDSASFVTGEWRFQEIALDAPRGRAAVAKDGTLNFADLLAPSADPVGAPPAKPAGKLRPLRIARLAVSAGEFAFADASRALPFETVVGPVDFSLTNFRTAGDPKAPSAFSAVTEAGEAFTWRGTLSIAPLRSTGEVTIDRIALKKYRAYLHDRLRADILAGSLDLKTRYEIDLTENAPVIALHDASAKLTALQVAERAATAPVVELPSVAITGVEVDVVKSALRVGRVALEGGRLKLRRAPDGSLKLLDLLPPPSPSAPTAASSTPPDVRVAEIAVNGLALDIEDRTTPVPARHVVEKLTANVRNFVLADARAPLPVKLSLALPPGGTVAVEGTVTRAPLALDLALDLAALPLAGATPYLEPQVNARIADGAVSLTGRARLAGGVATFQGAANVQRLNLVGAADAETLAKWSALELRGIELTTAAPLTVKIAEVDLAEPAGRLVINADSTTNLAALLAPRATAGAAENAPAVVLPPALGPASARPGSGGSPAAPAPVSPAAAAPALAWSVGKFTVSGGAFAFVDRSVKPTVQVALDSFAGTVAGLDSADLRRADVDLRGKVDGAGSVSLAGKLDLRALTAAPDARTELVLAVRDVDLSPVSPYVGAYAGYELARGGLAVDVKLALGRRAIESANVVTLRQFTLGAATNSPDATKLPVRLAIALLKDRDGKIVIDLPVQGSLDDPSFRVGRVVMRVVVNLLTKVATSPFSLLGAAFGGGGGDELAWQQFAPAARAPLDGEAKKLETLRKALGARPGLSVELGGSYDAAADAEALRAEKLNALLRTRLWEERRALDPATPPAEQLTVSAEDEARLVRAWFAALPGNAPVAPVVALTAPANPPAPSAAAKPAPASPAAPAVANPPAPAPAEKPGALQRFFGSFRLTTPGATATRAPAKPPATARAAVAAALPEQPPAPPTSATPAPALVALAAPASFGAVPAEAPSLDELKARWLATIEVGDDELRALARARAEAVRAALLADPAIAAERVFLSSAAQAKGARVFLELR